MNFKFVSACVFALSASAHAQLQFSNACDRGATTTISAVGDIIAHEALQTASLRSKNGFRALWQNVEGLIKKADVRYANLEAPAAAGMTLTNKQYSFNFDPRIVGELKRSGFSVISTANNHALDRGNAGIDGTINSFRREGLSYTGTYHSDGQSSPAAITRSGGVTLAWLSCTDLSNSGQSAQLQNCRSTRFLNAISHYAGQRDVDGVIVTPHWGVERATSPSGEQRTLAKTFFERGAIAIIGAHPHVLQKWEKMNIGGKERFVVYSLGNFISNQIYFGTAQLTGAILYLGFTKTSDGLIVNGARYTPTYMTRSPYFTALAATGNSDSRLHAMKSFDRQNELQPGEKLVTNPQCR